jgi:hypothetical protein
MSTARSLRRWLDTESRAEGGGDGEVNAVDGASKSSDSEFELEMWLMVAMCSAHGGQVAWSYKFR